MNARKTAARPGNPVADGLARLLADSYTLYLQTHNFHWNVTGPNFQSLHLMFETQYTELAAAVDEIAERIRALGALAPGSYAEYARLTSVQEKLGRLSASDMLATLIAGQGVVVATARAVLPVAESTGDDGTVDLLVRRMQQHEKNAWMLSSSLE